jgi:hypothetical protein
MRGTDPVLTTFFDLETQIRSRPDELQRQAAAHARHSSGELAGRPSTSPSRSIVTFVGAIQRALAAVGMASSAPVAYTTCA